MSLVKLFLRKKHLFYKKSAYYKILDVCINLFKKVEVENKLNTTYLDKLLLLMKISRCGSGIGENTELDLMKFWMKLPLFLRMSLHTAVASTFLSYPSFLFVTYLQKCCSSNEVYGVWDLHERIEIFVQIFQHLMEALHPAILDRARFGFGVAR